MLQFDRPVEVTFPLHVSTASHGAMPTPIVTSQPNTSITKGESFTIEVERQCRDFDNGVRYGAGYQSSISEHNRVQELHNLLKNYELCLLKSESDTITNNQEMKTSGGHCSRSYISVGGMQQLLNKSSHAKKDRNDGQGGDRLATIDELPDDVMWYIFNMFCAKDLCLLSGVCKRWYHLLHDELLWKNKLNRDVKLWPVIGHTTYPEMYKECESDWSSKEIYLRCCPEFNQLRQREFHHFINFSTLLRSLLPRHTPKIAMFGPGLESDTSSIFRRILWDKSGEFQRTAMIPGEVAGVGSGISFKLKNESDFHLFTLYSSTKDERQGRSPEQRVRKNKLLSQLLKNEEGEEGLGGEDAEAEFEPCDSVKEVGRKMNAFVFVVNASQEIPVTELRWSRYELFALVNDRWTNPSVPLLVLSCVKDSSKVRRPCVDIVNTLHLGKLSRPWQVRDCVVDELEGVASGIEWLLRRAQRS